MKLDGISILSSALTLASHEAIVPRQPSQSAAGDTTASRSIITVNRSRAKVDVN
jgi:hypothetical protein